MFCDILGGWIRESGLLECQRQQCNLQRIHRFRPVNIHTLVFFIASLYQSRVMNHGLCLFVYQSLRQSAVAVQTVQIRNATRHLARKRRETADIHRVCATRGLSPRWPVVRSYEPRTGQVPDWVSLLLFTKILTTYYLLYLLGLGYRPTTLLVSVSVTLTLCVRVKEEWYLTLCEVGIDQVLTLMLGSQAVYHCECHIDSGFNSLSWQHISLWYRIDIEWFHYCTSYLHSWPVDTKQLFHCLHTNIPTASNMLTPCKITLRAVSSLFHCLQRLNTSRRQVWPFWTWSWRPRPVQVWVSLPDRHINRHFHLMWLI